MSVENSRSQSSGENRSQFSDANKTNPHDVTKPRIVQTEGIASERDPRWQSNAKKGALALGAGIAVAALTKYAYTDAQSGEFNTGKAVKSLGKVLAIGGIEGIGGVAGITLRHHRELTHQSIELSQSLQKYIDTEQRALGVAEPQTWAAVHRIHHEMEDASLYPFYRIHHAMKEAEKRGIAVPEKFGAQLDPFVQEFDRATVDEIGAKADQIMRQRLDDERLGEHLYEKPSYEAVTDEEIEQILHPTEPQYTYPKYIKKTIAEQYSQDDIARLLLTDPHSPALMSVQGVAINGVNLYQSTANMFRAIPLLKPTDLQRNGDELPADERKKNTKNAVIGAFAVNVGLVFLANRDFSVRGAARAALEGSAINGVRGGMEIMGGNLTNSAGHMGDPVQTEIAQAFLNREYSIKLKEDGTISTSTLGKGPLGTVARIMTLDEVGGQEFHHEHPGAIKYTDKTGIEAWIEAPWGSFIEMLAKSEKVGLVSEGKAFSGDAREDVINSAVKTIQEKRAHQYAHDYARLHIPT